MAKVMVVDDSKTVRSYHNTLLVSDGFEVVEAENGMEALEKSFDNDIALYLVDVNMPIMDGYTFVKELRKQPSKIDIPIIIITTQAQQVDKIDAFKHGANLFETKPIKPDRLKSYLKLLLD
jgi:two-component system, chemotaxis family, chemotaxis protein CheY